MRLHVIVSIAALFVLTVLVAGCDGAGETLVLPTAAATTAPVHTATQPATATLESTATAEVVAALPTDAEVTATATATPLPPTPTATPLPTNTPIPTPAGPPQVILFMVVDSVRADHVSSYGYERPTTPNMDAWMAAQGMQFNHAISAAPWTCPSNAAMMSGLMPTRMNSSWDTMGNALPDNVTTLAEHLSSAGYYTAGFISNSCVAGQRGFDQGFDHYDSSLMEGRPQVDSVNTVNADEMNNLVWTWLQEEWLAGDNAAQPLFLFVYYMDPHVQYNPPPPYDTMYDPDYSGPFTPELFNIGQEVAEGSLVPNEQDIEHIQALYDGEISFWDAQLGNLLPALQGLGLLDNALIVITADHGDLFGEHGEWVHGTSLYEGVIRVPLLMRYPGRIPVGQVDTPVQSMDLMPTILELAGLAVPEGLDAISLAAAFRGEELPMRDIFSEVDTAPSPDHWAAWIAPDTDLRSVQRNNWKLIQHVGDEAANELYQLQVESPYEVENVAASEPAQAAELQTAIEEWFR
jgi:arylsulfatase A-like enzyme